jgi:hypothetical protein
MGIEARYTSPASRERSMRGATRVRVIGLACSFLLRGDPITLTLVAPRIDLSRFTGEVS